jgi:hypothetical protein
MMDTNGLIQTLSYIADFYDACKFGYEGVEGYRKSTNLAKLSKCAQELAALEFIDSRRTVLADLGCADGRVNILMSYFVKKSIGIEIDSEFLAEFVPRKEELVNRLQKANLLLPPDNVLLFRGNSLEASTYQRVFAEADVRFEDIDLFYTYITLHDVFAEKIALEAKKGSLYLVYGFNKVLPRYQGLELLIPDVASQGIGALYGKGSF